MERSSFFNAVLDQQGNPDRTYLAEDFAKYFASFIGNGVFPNPSNQLQVMANNDMTVTLKSGLAWINGYLYENTDNFILKLDPADGVLNRIDRIVLRLDFLERKIKAIIKKGIFASNPSAKTLQRDSDAYEIAIADIAISKGIINISQSNIMDLRLNKQLCGIVSGIISQADTTTIFNQYFDWYTKTVAKAGTDIESIKANLKSQFDTWFASIKGILSGDVAGNLQANIDKITAGIGGRNLVVDSLNLQNKCVPYGVEGTISKVGDIYPISKSCFKIECTKGGNGTFFFPIFQKSGEKVGRTFTWSCYIFTKTTLNLSMGHQSGGGIETVTTPSWKKISRTWTFTNSEYHQFYISNKSWNVGDTIYIADLKIEEGTVPSTWTPAPEDMAEKNHTHAETDITSGFTQWALPNGYRKLPGGMILQWGTIKTDSNSTGQTAGTVKLYDSWTVVKLPIKYEQFFRPFTNNQRFNGWSSCKPYDTGDKFDLYLTSTEGFNVVTGVEVSWFTIGY